MAGPCGSQAATVCNWVFEKSGNRGLAKASEWIVVRPLKVVLICLCAWALNRIARVAVDRVGDRARANVIEGATAVGSTDDVSAVRGRADARAQAVVSVLRGLTTAVLATVAVLLSLAAMGVQLGPLVAGAGLAGLAVGLGAQSLVRDVLAGMFILIEDQFGVGDIVDLGDASGTVERITLRSTRLRDVSGTVWHVPNGAIPRVGNKSQRWSRAVVDVSLDQSTDVSVAHPLIAETVASLWEDPNWRPRLVAPPEALGIQQMGPSGIVFRVTADTEPASQWMVERELRERIKKALDSGGIALARAPIAPVQGHA